MFLNVTFLVDFFILFNLLTKSSFKTIFHTHNNITKILIKKYYTMIKIFNILEYSA